MGRPMRRLTTFTCSGETLGASLDPADGAVGVLMVTGGSQTRTGSHRIYERLAKTLSERGYPMFRFDRRGVGDSSGDDPGFRGSGPDIAAALAAFRAEQPQLRAIAGFGLCDGATALALDAKPFERLILVNPWLVEADPGAPPPAAVREHYRTQLASREGWKRLLTGDLSYGKLVGGVLRAARATRTRLARQVAIALKSSGTPVHLILARRDGTAIAAAEQWRSKRFARVYSDPQFIESDSHTFARAGDADALLAAVLRVLPPPR
ncbi:exosortase A system-associated hydrolase 1 [Allosphingosinicella indica]|uniref:Exosortase A system-associated hydrolase 1 n=2 Tax=Allosphingosinicella indica TaxID=941907 RepID=A0A1X7GVJ6_9SPHN|nr:exosortase A system-associated hydrolase 1 [Allosphingosinicella indica]